MGIGRVRSLGDLIALWQGLELNLDDWWDRFLHCDDNKQNAIQKKVAVMKGYVDKEE